MTEPPGASSPDPRDPGGRLSVGPAGARSEPGPPADRGSGAPDRTRSAGGRTLEWSELERVTGAMTFPGNRLRLQFEGSSAFESWIEAIARARRFVYFENYLIRGDRVGLAVRDALVAKAAEGVPVRVIHDWVGCWATPAGYWAPLRAAGAEVRAFNPPSLALTNPFGVLQRDHRKMVVADGEVAFVGGFCVGQEWAGTETRAPWRDTAVEIRGPAAVATAVAFERVWARIDSPAPLAGALPPTPRAGPTPVWIIEGEPGRARVYRTLHLAAVRARERIWITDAYFVAPRSLSEALAAAARAGVDVRILLPANNNWPWVGSLSRGGYRFLLESGVRIFEWQGPMMHAKTAVVDGVWCRVGSSNLNAASLMGNWELDVGVYDAEVASQLEGLFLADLASSVEIVPPGRVRTEGPGPLGETRAEPLDPAGSLPARLERRLRELGSGGGGRLSIAPLARARTTLGDALAGNRPLGREDRTVLGTLAGVALALAGVAAMAPAAVGWMVAGVAGWLGLVTGARSWIQAHRARKEEREARAAAAPQPIESEAES